MTVFSITPQLFFLMALAAFISADAAVLAVKYYAGLKTDRIHEAAKFLFAAYMILAASLTLFPIKYLVNGQEPNFFAATVNFDPTTVIQTMISLLSIKQLPLIYKLRTFFLNIVGNLLLLMPFGFFLPFMKRRFGKPLYTLFLSFTVSCMIEFVQFLELSFSLTTGRACDIDDVILNVTGAAVGIAISKKITRRIAARI